jgi:site-specific recombinase XerC
MVPVVPELALLLRARLWSPAVMGDPKVYLLHQRDGAPWTRKMVEARTREWGRPCTPHRFRHTFATMLLERGANLVEIKEAMAYGDLSTTQGYAPGHHGAVMRRSNDPSLSRPAFLPRPEGAS